MQQLLFSLPGGGEFLLILLPLFLVGLLSIIIILVAVRNRRLKRENEVLRKTE